MGAHGAKVMRRILGEPMIRCVVEAAQGVDAHPIVVTGVCAGEVEDALAGTECVFVRQSEQLGTGHALQCAWPALSEDGQIWCVVVNGDTPGVTTEHIAALLARVKATDADMGFLTIRLEEPGSYGRVVRGTDNAVERIVEAVDVRPGEPAAESRDVNAGVFAFVRERVRTALFGLTRENRQGELYITDLVHHLLEQGGRVQALCLEDAALLGVNTPGELHDTEERLREAIVRRWMERGVVVHNPAAVRIGPRVHIEPGCDITGPAELYGATRLGRGAVLESHIVVIDSEIGTNAVVRSFSHLERVRMEADSIAGPFARLRPGTRLGGKARVGNFVEVKNSELGEGAKAGHLSYIGDARVGREVNIGAGTITCNYDGRSKHVTVIEDEAFIGSNTALVAPVRIGKKALIGAGSTITRNVADGDLALTRAEQRSRPRRK